MTSIISYQLKNILVAKNIFHINTLMQRGTPTARCQIKLVTYSTEKECPQRAIKRLTMMLNAVPGFNETFALVTLVFLYCNLISNSVNLRREFIWIVQFPTSFIFPFFPRMLIVNLQTATYLRTFAQTIWNRGGGCCM